MTRRPVAVALLVGVVAVAGCSGGRTKATTPEPVDACRIVTAEDAQKLLGGPAVSGPPQSTDRENVRAATCRYTPEGDTTRRVEVAVQQDNGQRDRIDAAVKALRDETFKGLRVEDVEGLGDAALWATGGPANLLAIFRGDYFVSISVPNTTSREEAVALGRAALDRLPKT